MICHTWALHSKLALFLLKTVFVEKPKLRLEYLSQDESGSLEIFTTDSVKDEEQNARNKFSLEALSFFFVNGTKKLRFTQIYNFCKVNRSKYISRTFKPKRAKKW